MTPGPMRRLGPRPLGFYLNWPDGWTGWSGAWPTLNATGGNPAVPWCADHVLVAGIAAYRRHPYVRRTTEPPTLWREGSTRLLDYRPAGGRPLLVVPSLINRAYILDLQPDHSMLRFLTRGGIRPLLLDWGFPDRGELDFTLEDATGRLLRTLDAVGEPVDLAGYCMGGLLAVAAAALSPDRVRRLALLAVPWDFHAPDPAPARHFAALLPVLEPMLALTGGLPVDLLQLLFAALDPGGVPAKFRAFAAMPADDPRAALFVAIEDWLADGVPLAAPIARETLADWYGANVPAAGTWRVAGEPVRPRRLAMPAFVAIPARDRIVPPESAAALAASLPAAHTVRPPAGHVGMVAGSRARNALWIPLAAWLGSGGSAYSGFEESAIETSCHEPSSCT